MVGNFHHDFDDVAVVSIEACEAPNVVTSAEIDQMLAPYYKRVGTGPGLLQKLAGIQERRQWPADVSFIDASVMAGERAISAAGVSPERIGFLTNTSVCRDRLEPSSAVSAHHRLGLPAQCINYDISNACLGFVNGMHLAGTLLEAGQIDYALIIDGEGTREIQQNTIDRLLDENSTMDDLFSNFASLTLGSGSAAMIMGRYSENPGSHRLVSCEFRSATEHHELCVGSLDGMRTDAKALLRAGTELGKIGWDEADKDNWGDMDRYIFHQVSRVHTAAMIDILEIDAQRVPLTFPTFGNIGPAALPFTLAREASTLDPGDRVLCVGVGSGLNVAFLELAW
ncbi:MAG: 3-oxoacyl-ACP synthase III [Granulosicoccus sp.]|nr:3-oxoacyl-ACP synthase III [Granulosicoccus sp.]